MLSIIIPTIPKNKDYLDNCIKSIKDHTDFEYEIIVELNGAGTDQPQGQCGAVNRGAKKAKGEWLFISNDDMYYPKEWARDLVMIGDCFSPNLIEPTNNHGSAHPFLKLDAGFTLDEFKPELVNDFMQEHLDCTVETGLNFPLFIKKELWERIGGYDEMYDPWGSNSDSDLQYKLEIAGIAPKRHRGMLVYHFSNKSGTFEPENQPYWQKNWEYFIDKWGFPREDTTWEHNLHIPLDKLLYSPKWSRYK